MPKNQRDNSIETPLGVPDLLHVEPSTLCKRRLGVSILLIRNALFPMKKKALSALSFARVWHTKRVPFPRE
jgi:hypothetical protein